MEQLGYNLTLHLQTIDKKVELSSCLSAILGGSGFSQQELQMDSLPKDQQGRGNFSCIHSPLSKGLCTSALWFYWQGVGVDSTVHISMLAMQIKGVKICDCLRVCFHTGSCALLLADLSCRSGWFRTIRSWEL